MGLEKVSELEKIVRNIYKICLENLKFPYSTYYVLMIVARREPAAQEFNINLSEYIRKIKNVIEASRYFLKTNDIIKLISMSKVLKLNKMVVAAIEKCLEKENITMYTRNEIKQYLFYISVALFIQKKIVI